MEKLKIKIEDIAFKYAELTEKRLLAALCEPETDSLAMSEINDGIRMLNHIASTLERIDRLERGNETSSQP